MGVLPSLISIHPGTFGGGTGRRLSEMGDNTEERFALASLSGWNCPTSRNIPGRVQHITCNRLVFFALKQKLINKIKKNYKLMALFAFLARMY
jgi:hypothetical protein